MSPLMLDAHHVTINHALDALAKHPRRPENIPFQDPQPEPGHCKPVRYRERTPRPVQHGQERGADDTPSKSAIHVC